MHIAKLFLILCCVLLQGCMRQHLEVRTETLTLERLASFHAGTPDFRKRCPDLGQRLIISWTLPPDFMNYEELMLILKVRFRNREEDEVYIPVNRRIGSYFYYLINERYFEVDGILTYRLDLYGDGQLLEEWRHQLWTELILFEDGSNDENCQI